MQLTFSNDHDSKFIIVHNKHDDSKIETERFIKLRESKKNGFLSRLHLLLGRPRRVDRRLRRVQRRLRRLASAPRHSVLSAPIRAQQPEIQGQGQVFGAETLQRLLDSKAFHLQFGGAEKCFFLGADDETLDVGVAGAEASRADAETLDFVADAEEVLRVISETYSELESALLLETEKGREDRRQKGREDGLYQSGRTDGFQAAGRDGRAVRAVGREQRCR